MSDPGGNVTPEISSVAENHQKSGFRFYSIGVVNSNKPMSMQSIEVTPIEFFSLVNGELTDFKEDLETSSTDYAGQEWNEKLVSTPGIMARWIPIGQTHRLTAPDVRRGDLVLLYQFGDTDEYWWEELRPNDKRIIRRLETIIWGISNNRKENVPDDYDSRYTVEWSTHRKVLHIHTSKSDGEPFEYDIQLDTKNGRFVIKDDDDNYIEFDSKKRFIKVHNKDKSFVQLDRKIITIQSVDKVIVNTDHFEVNAKSTIKHVTKDYSIKTNSYKLSTSSYQTNASTWTTTVPKAVFSRDIHVGGNQTTSGTSDNHHTH